LIRSSLTSGPSPARVTGKKPQILIAREGSSGERGLCLLSYTLSFLNIIENRVKRIILFERGTQGVSKKPDANSIFYKRGWDWPA